MPTVTYVGKQIKRAKVMDLTVGSATAAQTFITTVGGSKAVTYVVGSGETTTTVAAAILALLQAEDAGEFAALEFAAHPTDATVIRVTGPDDGYPFTIAASGTGTYTATTITTPLSPYDVSDVLNYSGGALPAAADTLVVENTDADLRYNLTALTNAITFIRRATHTGRIGLPSENEAGYPEYLGTLLELNAGTVTIESNGTDRAGQVRITSTHAGGEVYVIQGEGAATLGEEPVEVTSLAGAASLVVTNSGVAISPLAGQTAVIVDLLGEASAVRVGPGVTVTSHVYSTCEVQVQATWSTDLRATKGSTITVLDSAAAGAQPTRLFDSTIIWKSKGACSSAVYLNGSSTFDASDATVSSVITTGNLYMQRGSSLIDPRFRAPFVVILDGCNLPDVTIDQGLGRTYTPS